MMTHIYLMRGQSVSCYAPFVEGGSLDSVQAAFDYAGRVFGKMSCSTNAQIGDVVEVVHSLAWSAKAHSVLSEFRFSPTMRARELDIMTNNGSRVLATSYCWYVDFADYDVLNRQLSEYKGIPKYPQVVLGLRKAVVDARKLPDCDIWGSMYSNEFFVTSSIKKALATSGCTGFSFRKVDVVD